MAARGTPRRAAPACRHPACHCRACFNGLPTRAEPTDAAMAQRAERVMLIKGPYVVQAVHFLVDVLGRMTRHQHKKSQHFSRLGSWPPDQLAL